MISGPDPHIHPPSPSPQQLPPKNEEPRSFLSGIFETIVSSAIWLYQKLPSFNSGERKVSQEIELNPKIEVITQKHLLAMGPQVDTLETQENQQMEQKAPPEGGEKKLTKTEQKKLKASARALRELAQAEAANRASEAGGAAASVVTKPVAVPAYQGFLAKNLKQKDIHFAVHSRVSRWSSIKDLEEISYFPDKTVSGEERRYEKTWLSDPVLGPIRIAEQQVRHDASLILKLLANRTFLEKYTAKSGGLTQERTLFLKTRVVNASARVEEQQWGVTTLGFSQKNELYHYYSDSRSEVARREHQGLFRPMFGGLPLLHLDKELEDLTATPVLIHSEKDVKYYEIPQNNSDSAPVILVVKQNPVTGLTLLFIAPIPQQVN